MTTLPDWLRPIFARVVASAVAALLAYLTRKGIDLGLSDLDVAKFSEGISAVTWGVMLAAYAAIHRLISVKTNPTDSAAPAMAGTATGPLGAGERAALGAALDAVAKTAERPVPVPPPVSDDQRRAGWASRPPDARTVPVAIPEPDESTAFGDGFVPVEPPKRERRKRAPRVVVQEPGAAPPPTEHAEPSTGYEP